METLEISDRTIKTEISIYTGGTDLKFYGSIYPDKNHPDWFKLPKNTIFFTITEIETLITPDGKKYVSDDNKQNVYMGKAISIEEAIKENPEYTNQFSYYRDRENIERVVVRNDGIMNIMYQNDITYNEYCEKYKQSNNQKHKM